MDQQWHIINTDWSCSIGLAHWRSRGKQRIDIRVWTRIRVCVTSSCFGQKLLFSKTEVVVFGQSLRKYCLFVKKGQTLEKVTYKSNDILTRSLKYLECSSTLRTQSSNKTTILMVFSHPLIKLTNDLWSALSTSCPLMERMTSPSRRPDLKAGPRKSTWSTYVRSSTSPSFLWWMP